MLSEKLAKYSMIRDDKFIDEKKNSKKKHYFLARNLVRTHGGVVVCGRTLWERVRPAAFELEAFARHLSEWAQQKGLVKTKIKREIGLLDRDTLPMVLLFII